MSRQFFEALAANDGEKPMRECGFAIVSVIFSYFEMIAQYLQGTSSVTVQPAGSSLGAGRPWRWAVSAAWR